MERFFGGGNGSAMLLSSDWEPHTPEAIQSGVFASRWPATDGSGRVLWTLVNRGGINLTGTQLAVRMPTAQPKAVHGQAAARFYDCYRGVEIVPHTGPPPPPPRGFVTFKGANCYDGHGATDLDKTPVSNQTVAECEARCDAHSACMCAVHAQTISPAGDDKGACWMRSDCVLPKCDRATSAYSTYLNQSRLPPPPPLPGGTVGLAFDFAADDYGCVLQTGPEAPDAALTAFLAEMAAMTTATLSSLDGTWKVMHQTLVPIPPSPPARKPPPGTVRIPAAAAYDFVTRGIEIEGDDAHGVDVQFPWEEAYAPPRPLP